MLRAPAVELALGISKQGARVEPPQQVADKLVADKPANPRSAPEGAVEMLEARQAANHL